MIWGVGVGRCGTTSLTAERGGVHEPWPDLGFMGQMAWTNRLATFKLKRLLEERRDLDVPIVVDWKHSILMPVIKALDSDAEFVWIYREPAGTITSHGIYQSLSDWDYTRWYRKELVGLPRYLQRTTAKYIILHEFIMSFFEQGGCPFEVISMNDLTVHENESDSDRVETIVDVQKRFAPIIKKYTEEVWQRTLRFVDRHQ